MSTQGETKAGRVLHEHLLQRLHFSVSLSLARQTSNKPHTYTPFKERKTTLTTSAHINAIVTLSLTVLIELCLLGLDGAGLEAEVGAQEGDGGEDGDGFAAVSVGGFVNHV